MHAEVIKFLTITEAFFDQIILIPYGGVVGQIIDRVASGVVGLVKVYLFLCTQKCLGQRAQEHIALHISSNLVQITVLGPVHELTHHQQIESILLNQKGKNKTKKKQ